MISNNNKFIYHHSNDLDQITYIMEKHGHATARTCIYNEDKNYMLYIYGVSVSPNKRQKGLGNEILNLCENIGKRNNVKYICLAVKDKTWMLEWYKRKGYIEFENYHFENENDTIWMKKKLIYE